ncbi:Crp/Fnr family transcriptional regulator [Romboutsia ilealis]|uniref:Crp/Fnr family transcriptional regulator n=1 Tax=Romboutsia faecis TaxID=2764597 RepID=A0ABR7JMU1_9FIRM|nr:Crp/Fnr family transcriptional regulator [Romboutsia faecis]MRN25146.1 Crp/Fnr family transcriptional regulator [Romboutsia ilealis]
MDKKEILEEILPFFNSLSVKESQELISKSILIKYEEGKIVHNKNSTCTGLLITISGQFRTFISAPSGREITLFRLLDRDVCILSASCAFQNITYDINLESEKESLAIIIDSSIIKDLSKSNAKVLEFLLNITQNKLSEVMYVLEQAVFFSLDSRISNFLIEESNLTNSSTLYLTHESIANHIGSSREVVSKILKKFERDDIIEISRGKLKILNIEKLNNLSNS